MRISLDITALQDGNSFRGIGTYVRGLLYGLAELRTDDEFTLYYWRGLPLNLDRASLPKRTRKVGVPYLHFGRFSALVAQQLLLTPYLLAQPTDLYHQPGIVADPSASGLPWAVLRRAVVTIHDLTPLVFPDRFFERKRIREASYRIMLKGAATARRVITDSQCTKVDILRLLGVAPERVDVVPLAVSPEFIAAVRSDPFATPALHIPPPYVLTVAGDYPNKNLATLLQSFPMLAKRVPEASLVLVGPSGPTIERFRREHPSLAARVCRFERLTVPQLAHLYKRATVVAVPSEYEGFGLPVLEAMTAGTPVVAACAASLPEVAGDAAVLVPPRDPHALAEAITLVFRNAAVRASLCASGKQRSAAFTWRRTAAATLDAYYRAVEHH